MATLNARNPRDSSYGRDYWLHRCEGFRVEVRGRLIGKVRGLRFRGSIEPDQLEVRNGFFGRRVFLIPVERVDEIIPEQKLIILHPQNPRSEPDRPL